MSGCVMGLDAACVNFDSVDWSALRICEVDGGIMGGDE